MMHCLCWTSFLRNWSKSVRFSTFQKQWWSQRRLNHQGLWQHIAVNNGKFWRLQLAINGWVACWVQALPQMPILIWNVTYGRHRGVFLANKETLCAKNVAIQKRLRFSGGYHPNCLLWCLFSDPSFIGLGEVGTHPWELIGPTFGTMFCTFGTRERERERERERRKKKERERERENPNWSSNVQFLLGRLLVYINSGNLQHILPIYRLQGGWDGYSFGSRKGRRWLDDLYKHGIPNWEPFVGTMGWCCTRFATLALLGSSLCGV